VPGISRTRLRVDQARSRFMPTNVDAREVDFSDRVSGKRKSYKTSSRRQKILDDGVVELGDLSDDEDGESLERKIARLQREVEEAKGEYNRLTAEAPEPTKAAADQGITLQTLSQALGEIAQFPDRRVPGLRSQAARSAAAALPGEQTATEPGPHTVTYLAAPKQLQPLESAAEFDRRLLVLEKAIGIGSSALPELDATSLPRAIVPTLETLQKQISTLTEASTASLDGISRRVRALIQESEELAKSRRSAKAAQEALAQAGAAPTEAAEGVDSEQAAKINALYGVLPTIENLAPVLPLLLDRLRSLRAIHADAATASQALSDIEGQQKDMASDIKQWREGLGKIEKVMEDGETAMAGNMTIIDGWLKELEAKMTKLS